MTRARRVTYKKWAGISIRGNTKWEPSTVKKTNHLDKATWLTAAAEGGSMFGTVQSYDGAGISAGLEHQIAVLPRTLEQGGLWNQLRKLDESLPDTNPHWIALKNEFDKVGWVLDTRGVLRHKTTGTPVGGAEIRNEIAPVNGVVPESGPDFEKAVRWAEVFNDLYEDPATFNSQIRETKNGLLSLHKDTESQVYKRYCKIDDASVAEVGTNISPELDLAMCFYHSFSVNAPSKARGVLTEVLGRGLGPVDFAKQLVKALGTNSYANWTVRYTRTRSLAQASGLFDTGLFNSVAPANL